MKERQIVAIDVGSSNVVIAVGTVENDGRVNIQGIASEPISGIDAGHVENSETAGRAVRAVKERIEQELNIKITEAYAGLSGDFVRCVQVTDYVYVKDELGSNQITDSDLEDLDRRMRSVKLPDDREDIIHMEAIRYTIDDKVVDEPVGSYGHVLKATYNFILTDRNMRERLNQCLKKQNITVKDFVPNAFISHLAVATDEDIEEGAVIVDLGGGVTDVAVLLRGKVRHIASIPIGSDAINSDIRAYGIHANYIENLKRRYGSALTEMTTDDKIVFPTRRSVPKSILRRNLATIIEARLSEIADWVRREIKDAGCGSKFAPVLLLTGGGAEMQNIEALFARKLGIDDVRVVYPEYGFTENMTDHITTTAYATVASLLLYGSMHGACSVAVGSNRDVHKPVDGTPVAPTEDKQTQATKDQEQRVEEKTKEEKIKEGKTKEEAKQTPTSTITVDPTPIENVTKTKNNDDDIFSTDGDDDEKPNWWDKFKKTISNMGESFAGKDEADF